MCVQGWESLGGFETYSFSTHRGYFSSPTLLKYLTAASNYAPVSLTLALQKNSCALRFLRSFYSLRRDFNLCTNLFWTIAKRLTCNARSAWWFCAPRCLPSVGTKNKEISILFFVGSSPDPSTENWVGRIFICFGSAASSSKKLRSVPIIFESLPLHFSPSLRRARRAPVPNVRGISSVRSHAPAPPHSSLTGWRPFARTAAVLLCELGGFGRVRGNSEKSGLCQTCRIVQTNHIALAPPIQCTHKSHRLANKTSRDGELPQHLLHSIGRLSVCDYFKVATLVHLTPRFTFLCPLSLTISVATYLTLVECIVVFVKNFYNKCYWISFFFSSNSCLSISPLVYRSFKISSADFL